MSQFNLFNGNPHFPNDGFINKNIIPLKKILSFQSAVAASVPSELHCVTNKFKISEPIDLIIINYY